VGEATLVAAAEPPTLVRVTGFVKRYGKRTPAYLDAIGYLDGQLAAVHLTEATDEETALIAASRKADIEFHLLGYAYRSLRTQPKARLTVYGEYDENDLDQLLAWLKPNLVWFPALWPETYSYTLSACLKAGLPVVAPDLGAFTERLAGRPWSWLCHWERNAADWVSFFETVRERHFTTGQPPEIVPAVARPVADFSYAHHYLEHIAARPGGPALSKELLGRHARNQLEGLDATRAELKDQALQLLATLRNATLLRGAAKRFPLRWQTRVKTWLQG